MPNRALGLNQICYAWNLGLSHVHQVFDEMLERTFTPVSGQFTYAEKWGQLSNVGREWQVLRHENSPSSC